MKYGCFDRAPYKPEQVLHGHNSQTGEAIVTTVPFRNKQSCQYRFTELGRADEKCEGCQRKNDPDE